MATSCLDLEGVSREEIIEHLETILADRRFAGAERNARFLRSVVEKTLAGHAREIKEVTIALEVYGRAGDYDPKSDSIVRVEATRLRQKLRSYYENEGRNEAIRIHLPSGSYVPRFERVGEVPPEPPAAATTKTHPRPRPATVALALVLALMIPIRAVRGSKPDPADTDAALAVREAQLLLLLDPHFGNMESGPPKTLLRATERLEYAVARKPGFAAAWATLAEAYDYAAEFAGPDPAGAARRAEAAARRAIALDPRLAAGHHMLALHLKNSKWDFARAEAAYQRALAIDPNNAYAVVEYADLLWETGRPQAAEARMREARALLPGLPVLAWKEAEIQLGLGRPDAALAAAKLAVELKRDYRRAYVVMAMAYERKGDTAAARALYEKVLSVNPHDRRALPAYGYLLARTGESQRAREVAHTLEKLNSSVRNCAFQVAVVYAGLGEHERALDWLERAWRTRQSHFPFAAAEDRFRDLHQHPRFRQLLGRVGLTPVPRAG